MKTNLPDEYLDIPDNELVERIRKVKEAMKDELVVLAHHYQSQTIVDFGDFLGDSYKLCVAAADQTKAKYIAFCGVEFMAESAAILCRDDQRVFHPEFEAGCPMADMADLDQVKRAWDQISRVIDTNKTIPVTYMNSTGDIKAFCGARAGCVVTSSNAPAGFKWAFERGDRVFFFPDEHLGTNTAHKLGIGPDEFAIWDPFKEMGGLDEEKIKKARVIIWKGFCHVHTFFTVDQIAEARKKHAGVKVVVHPECPREVVEAADADGSTEFIIKYVEDAPAGTSIAIGTEINLVSRLANKHKDKKVFKLAGSDCPNMHKINLNKLCFTLENLPEANLFEVDTDLAEDARKALKRMLEIK